MMRKACQGLNAKRLPNDIKLLAGEKDALEARGIYVHVDEDNMSNIDVLVVPRHKLDADVPGLESPYTGGMFLFEIRPGADYPMAPPKVTFHPQQDHCRLHPNYYEGGKCCLSIINTWGGHDWSPSMSILAIINTLEERFNERAICFEPGNENSTASKMMAFNAGVEYGKLKWVVLPVMRGGTHRHAAYAKFADVLRLEFDRNYDFYVRRLAILAEGYDGKMVGQASYLHGFVIETAPLAAELAALQRTRV